VDPQHRKQQACLLIHGFSGGAFEMEPLGAYLRERGWSCRIPTLPGHEEDMLNIGAVTWRDWVAKAEGEAEQAVKQFGSIDLIGFSMGGFIAAYLANRYPVRRLVVLNAPLIYASPGRFIRETSNQIRCKDWSRMRKIRKVPFKATWQFMQLIRRLRREFAMVKAPTLIVQGEKDPIVHPYGAKLLYKFIHAEKEIRMYPKSRHLICHDVEAGTVFRDIETFLRR
jgi:carboxylesterase